MVVLIVCLVLIAIALIWLGGLVVGLLGHIRSFAREVGRARTTMGQVEAALAALPGRGERDPAATPER